MFGDLADSFAPAKESSELCHIPPQLRSLSILFFQYQALHTVFPYQINERNMTCPFCQIQYLFAHRALVIISFFLFIRASLSRANATRASSESKLMTRAASFSLERMV